jgi:hypothetical protein
VSLPLLRSAALAALLLAAGPAFALDDLTGTYEGTIRCESTDASDTERSTLDAALYVDDANDGNAFAYLNNSGLVFRLGVVSPTSDAGALGGPSCTMSSTVGGFLLWASVKAKAGSEKASLRGEVIATNVGAASHLVQVCRLSLKRTSTKIAFPIPGCP